MPDNSLTTVVNLVNDQNQVFGLGLKPIPNPRAIRFDLVFGSPYLNLLLFAVYSNYEIMRAAT